MFYAKETLALVSVFFTVAAANFVEDVGNQIQLQMDSAMSNAKSQFAQHQESLEKLQRQAKDMQDKAAAAAKDLQDKAVAAAKERTGKSSTDQDDDTANSGKSDYSDYHETYSYTSSSSSGDDDEPVMEGHAEGYHSHVNCEKEVRRTKDSVTSFVSCKQ